MDKEKSNYYAIIPADVRYCKRISANAKLLFAELTTLADKDGKVFVTNDALAETFSVSRASVTRWLTELTNENFIACGHHYDHALRHNVRFILLGGV